jgi:hypothetical protein
MKVQGMKIQELQAMSTILMVSKSMRIHILRTHDFFGEFERGTIQVYRVNALVSLTHD